MNKLVLLTGFLGAGKTTFLNNVLEEYRDSRIGLIVNEFAETGVDGALVRQDIPGTNLKELTNGSIFCACIKDTFVDSLVDMGRQGCDYVFIEASGLADPSSIASILDQIRQFACVTYDYLGSVCLVDAQHFVKHATVLVSLQRQIMYSRTVVLNKTDLVDDEGLAAVIEAIRKYNPTIPIHPTTFAQVSLKDLLAEESGAIPAPQESTNTVSSRPTVITLVTSEAADPAALETFLLAIAPSTYRIKGFCLTTEGTKNVSLVGTSCRIEAWDEPVEETRLVIISSVGIRIMSETLEAAEKCYREPVSIQK